MALTSTFTLGVAYTDEQRTGVHKINDWVFTDGKLVIEGDEGKALELMLCSFYGCDVTFSSDNANAGATDDASSGSLAVSGTKPGSAPAAPVAPVAPAAPAAPAPKPAAPAAPAAPAK